MQLVSAGEDNILKRGGVRGPIKEVENAHFWCPRGETESEGVAYTRANTGSVGRIISFEKFGTLKNDVFSFWDMA